MDKWARYLVLATAVCLIALAGMAEKPKPNFIIILADDLGYGDIAGFGFPASGALTPRLSKMAAEGVRLTRFMTTMPYCAPSRASLLTGRYPFHHQIVANPTPDRGIDDYGLAPAEVTIAELLKPAGYDCYAVGKWHLGHKPQFLPVRQGFDEYYGILYSNDMRPVQIVENEQVVEYPVDQSLLTQKYTRKSIGYMRRSVAAKRPFFLYLAHTMPHKPLAASAEFYNPETPGNLYEDVIRELDWSVGEILDEVRGLGIDRETLIVFSSDNGPYYGGNAGGLRGMKAQSWDGGSRVPCIARWPGHIPPGNANPSLASTIDLLPTFAKLADAELLHGIDGKDLWPVLTDPSAESPHPFFVCMRGHQIKTVHSGKWKLHVLPAEQYRPPSAKQINSQKVRLPDGTTIIAPAEQYPADAFPGLTAGDKSCPLMLFDLDADPGEQHNVAAQHPEVVERLKMLYDTVAVPPPVIDVPKPSEYRNIKGGKLDFWNE